ncbi:MAG: hypothetical protein LBH18_06190 [Spirochaetaceae bacterium]|nr:hypothetical protein [Spirochaetaceae bacterium]
MAALIAAIVLGTIWVLAAKPHEKIAAKSAGVGKPETPIFTGIGRMRVKLAPPTQTNEISVNVGSTVVIAVEFPYDDTDGAFLEELSLNVGKFRSETVDYFASVPADSPLLANETLLKQGLLSRYNSLLYLGKIKELYFSEFMLID